MEGISVRWDQNDCDQYSKCRGMGRCPFLTMVNYMAQEHEIVHHPHSLRYRVDVTRDNEKPYCSFVFEVETGHPGAEELAREVRQTLGVEC